MRFHGEITRRNSEINVACHWRFVSGWEETVPWFCEERMSRSEKKKRKKNEETVNGKGRRERDGKGRKETRKSLRYLKRVTRCRVKKFFFLSFFLFLFSPTLFLSLLRRATTSRVSYELCMREDVKFYDIYMYDRAWWFKTSRRNPRIYYMLFN